MSERIVGKPSPRRLDSLLEGNLGAKSEKIILGPGAGLDAAVLDIGGGMIMAIAEDPIFPAPNLPLELMGYFTVHIGASDVAVMGVKPRFMTYTLLLPTSCDEDCASLIIKSISETAAEMGITIAGGHTGWYDAVAVPIVGGVTVWGFAPSDRWISPGGARDGDVILMTKGPAIEAAALLGVLYREKLCGRMSPGLIEKACARTSEISVVADALTAYGASPGVHAMHDATEGGVLGGLWEMQSASGIPVQADIDGIPVPDDIKALSEALGFDPWQAISEGTLLAAVAPEAADAVSEELMKKGIDSFRLGRFNASAAGGALKRGGRETPLAEPGVDPFWDLFFKGLNG